MRSMALENASSSARSGVMSLNRMPGCGKSGMSRMSPLIRSIVAAIAPPASIASAIDGTPLSPTGLGLALGLLLLAGLAAARPRLAGAPGRPRARPPLPSRARPSPDGRAGPFQLAFSVGGGHLAPGRDRPQPWPGPALLGLHPDLLVPRFLLLEQREDGRGDEDRRVRP